MKLLIFVALAVAIVTAKKIIPRHRVMPVMKHEGRIAGGENADIVNFNYQVGLSLKENMFGTFWCGGSLISSEWVLTAAHCMEDIYKITVYLGGTKRAQAEVELDILRNADNVIVHEGFNGKTMLNDIALIKIPPVKFSDRIQPIRLYSCNDGTFPGDFIQLDECNYGTFPGDFATTSGWGQKGDDDFGIPTTLQSVSLRILSNPECAKTYSNYIITKGNICLATNDDRVMRSTCDGDSGGPLVVKGTNLQIGLTSFGAKKGCELGYPVVFTRISAFVDWISAKTGITIEKVKKN